MEIPSMGNTSGVGAVGGAGGQSRKPKGGLKGFVASFAKAVGMGKRPLKVTHPPTESQCGSENQPLAQKPSQPARPAVEALKARRSRWSGIERQFLDALKKQDVALGPMEKSDWWALDLLIAKETRVTLQAVKSCIDRDTPASASYLRMLAKAIAPEELKTTDPRRLAVYNALQALATKAEKPPEA